MLNFDAFELVDELPPGKHAYDMVWVDEWRCHDFVCDSSRPRDSEMICLRERQTRFSSSICWPKLRVARISVYSLSTLVMHSCTLEQMRNLCENAFRYQEFKILTTKAAVNGTRKASKHWQEFSCDKLVTKMIFQLIDINPCNLKRFCDNLDLEQHGDDFLVCGSTSNLEVLADELKNNFLVKKAEIVNLGP